jgi:hypothetical protein
MRGRIWHALIFSAHPAKRGSGTHTACPTWIPLKPSFIHRENLQRLRRLLAETPDESQRQQILKLLAEEEAKDQLRSEKS